MTWCVVGPGAAANVHTRCIWVVSGIEVIVKGLQNLQARFPLLQRVEPDVSVAATSSATVAGGPSRYLLPVNNTGVLMFLLARSEI